MSGNEGQTMTATLKGRSRRDAFTLLELLVVMAIIGILVAMTTLSITNMGEGQKLTTGGNAAVDLINNARQIAKTKNTKTMVVMLDKGVDARRTFTVMEYDLAAGNWSQVDKWRKLPDGIAANEASLQNFFVSTITNMNYLNTQTNVVGALFMPDGRPWGAVSNLVLQIENTNRSSSTNNYYKIIVNHSTGVPIVRRP